MPLSPVHLMKFSLNELKQEGRAQNAKKSIWVITSWRIKSDKQTNKGKKIEINQMIESVEDD